MRIEQRIGRVDRIGQRHVVRHQLCTGRHRGAPGRQVLEEKLEVIAQQFGVDKASDVMDSAEAEPLFEELFAHGLQNRLRSSRNAMRWFRSCARDLGRVEKSSELFRTRTLEATMPARARPPAQF